MNSIPTTRQTCTQGNLIGRLLLGLILLAVSNLPGFAQAPLTPTVSLRSSATVDPDDMCFVRTSAEAGVIVVSDKSAGMVFLFDDSGRELDSVRIPKPGNIDSRDGFVLDGERVPIIVVNQREPVPQLRALTIQIVDGQPRLKPLQTDIPTGPNYGGCLYRGQKDRLYFFSTTEGGTVRQIELLSNTGKSGSTTITGKVVRSWNSPICEGAVADDSQQCVYVDEEDLGIRKLGAEPDAPAPGSWIVRVGEHGITGDLEGITLLPTGETTGFLIASDQNRNRFIVLDRTAPHRFLGEFAIRNAMHTDGVDVTAMPLGKKFPRGVFASHTDSGKQRSVLLTPLPTLIESLKEISRAAQQSVED